MIRFKHAPTVLPVVLFASTLLGCEPLDDVFGGIDPVDPACQGPRAEVGGTWQITGSGERSGCDDSMFNASLFELRSDPLPVLQTDDLLELEDDPSRAGFSFVDGSVDGQCVTFRTSESTDLGLIEYEWTGVATDGGAPIVGELTGTGPRGCDIRGNFRIAITTADP